MSQRKAKATSKAAPEVETLNVDEINGRLQALAAQRNEAQNQVAVLQGKLTAASAQIAQLQEALKAATPAA